MTKADFSLCQYLFHVRLQQQSEQGMSRKPVQGQRKKLIQQQKQESLSSFNVETALYTIGLGT